jgi:hypothetical protein
MELFFTDRRPAVAAGVVPGIDPADVRAVFERRVALDGIPVLLAEAMRQVEPLSSWFRHLASMGRSPKTMCKYAYVAVWLAEFLAQGGTDLVSATETDLSEYRALRTRDQLEPISKPTWEVEARRPSLYAWLTEQATVPSGSWPARPTSRRYRYCSNCIARFRPPTTQHST